MVGRLLGLCLAILALRGADGVERRRLGVCVGDSLGVGTFALPARTARRHGPRGRRRRSSGPGAGVVVLASLIAPEYDVVIFDLGTNDDPAAPAALGADLAPGATSSAANRCLVIATLNRPPLNGVPVDGLNRAVTSFAARDPNVALVNWRAAVAADPGAGDRRNPPRRRGLCAARRPVRRRDLLVHRPWRSKGGPRRRSSSTSPRPACRPAASAGRNTGGAGGTRRTRTSLAAGGQTPRVEALATALGRAVATGDRLRLSDPQPLSRRPGLLAYCLRFLRHRLGELSGGHSTVSFRFPLLAGSTPCPLPVSFSFSLLVLPPATFFSLPLATLSSSRGLARFAVATSSTLWQAAKNRGHVSAEQLRALGPRATLCSFGCGLAARRSRRRARRPRQELLGRAPTRPLNEPGLSTTGSRSSRFCTVTGCWLLDARP